MQYINLTGLDIRLVTPSGEVKLDLPAGPHRAQVDAIHGIHLTTPEGVVTPGFPWKKEGTTYVVLSPLTETLHRRNDIVILGDIVLTDDGSILGHSSFVSRG
jgi:hypothetical protein